MIYLDAKERCINHLIDLIIALLAGKIVPDDAAKKLANDLFNLKYKHDS